MIFARAQAAVPEMTPEVIFQVLPPSYGKSLLVLLLFTCFFLGATVMEFFNHLADDFRLMAKPGWGEASKCISRLAYFGSRYLSIACVSFMLCSLTLKMDNCMVFPLLVEVPGILVFASNSLTFALRTMALYNRERKIVIPVFVYWSLTLAASAACIPFYVPEAHLPGTLFCTYGPPKNYTASLTTIIIYKVLGLSFDTTLLVLTLHRLLDGGLPSLWTRDSRQTHSKEKTSLSAFLVRQGFHFYVVQMLCDIFFIAGYWGFKDPFYRVLPSAVSLSVPALAAAGAYRDMGRRARSIGLKNALHVNEVITSSHNSRSGGGLGNGTTLIDSKLATKGASESTTAAGTRDRMSAYVLSTLSIASKTETIQHDKTTRVTFGNKLDGSKKKGFFRSIPHPADVDNISGIVVTVGTVSRTDAIEEEWEGDESSSLEAIKLQRLYSQRSSNGGQESITDKHSTDGLN